MAESYDIYKNDIKKMVTEQIADLIEEKVDDKKDEIDGKYHQLRKELDDKHLPDDEYMKEEDVLDILYEKEMENIYSVIGKELDPACTGTTEDKLITYFTNTKMRLFTTELGKISLCNQYIRTCLNLDHGDIVQIGGQTYRNENVMFWSSTDGLLYPDASSPQASDYGTVPSIFRVGNGKDEFHPCHWKEAFDGYDGTIWLSDSLRDEIITSLKEVPYKSLPKTVLPQPGDGSIFHTEVNICGTSMHIVSATATPKYFQLIEKNVIEGDE